MTMTKWLAAATLVTATIATPALAQDRYGYNDGWNNNGYWRGNDTGFLPGDVAVGVVGGAVAASRAAVNTAGAIATAPLGGYNASYDNGWDRGWNNGGFYDSNAAYRDDDDVVARPQSRIQARANNPFASPYNNGSNASNGVTSSYAERNGFVCTPGTYYTNINGRQVLCQ